MSGSALELGVEGETGTREGTTLQKLKARKINSGHIGKWVSIFHKTKDQGLIEVEGGYGKLVNYCQKGLEVSFILGGSFDPVTVDQNDIVEIVDYLDEEGWVVVQ